MSSSTTQAPLAATNQAAYGIERVFLAAPFGWIRGGIADFRRVPLLSLLYGVLFAALCGGVYLLVRSVPWFALAYVTGLVVVGPFLASGLYTASRELERGAVPTITGSLRLLSQRGTYLALFSLLLALLMAAWIRFSALLFAIKFNTLSPSIQAYRDMLGSSDGWIVLSFFVGIGFLLAALVFVVSAVAIPLILDRDADLVAAVATSARAVRRNPGVMAIWATTIVALTAIGIATAFVGMVVIFPVLGYATWHSYRALVK